MVKAQKARQQEEPGQRSPARNAATTGERVRPGEDEEQSSELADRVGCERR